MTREHLPNRRDGETLSFTFRGGEYVVTRSLYPDNRLAEVFIDPVGMTAKGMTPVVEDTKDAAVCLSIALQYGAPAHVISGAVSRLSDGTPTGIIGCVLDLLEGEKQK